MWVTVQNKQYDAVKCLSDFVIIAPDGRDRQARAGHWLLMLETGPICLDDATFKAMFLTMPLSERHELLRCKDRECPTSTPTPDRYPLVGKESKTWSELSYTYPSPEAEHWIRDDAHSTPSVTVKYLAERKQEADAHE